jgi:hypothetical protein
MPEVLPQLALLVGLFFALVGYMAARGSLAIWTHSLGYLLEGLARILRFSVGKWPAKVTIDLGGPVRALNNAVISALQTWADGAEIEIGYFLHGNAILWHWMVSELDSFAQSSAQFGEWLIHVRLPKWAKYAALAALPAGLLAKLIKAAIAHELPQLTRTVKVIERTLPGKTITIVKRAAAVAIPGVIALPWLEREWRGLTRRMARINSRLRRLELLLTATGLAVAVANMTGTSFRCWRGQGNIARAARHLCGLERGLLDLLLLGTVEAFIASDLCGFTDLLIKEAEHLRPALLTLVDVEDVLIDCHGTSKPPDLTLPQLSLPPMSAPSVLAA